MQRLPLQNLAAKNIATKTLAVALLSATTLTACGSARETSASAPQIAPDSQMEGEAAPAGAAGGNSGNVAEFSAKNDTAPQKPQAQLIKKATIALEVEDTQKSIKTVTQLIARQQGDILNLQSDSPQDGSAVEQANLTVRVPQGNLDATLTELATLGKVLSQGIEADDVSTQLVDANARLRNLRKAEEATLKILDRSGSVSDVLKVSQEVTKIREQIEQIDAQLTSLKSQVAYSTITLRLEESVASLVPQKALGSELKSTWNSAVQSSQGFGRGLLSLGIWLFAYSPYLLAIGGGTWFLRHTRRRQQATPPLPTPAPRVEVGTGPNPD